MPLSNDPGPHQRMSEHRILLAASGRDVHLEGLRKRATTPAEREEALARRGGGR